MYETNHQVRRPAAGPGAAVRRVRQKQPAQPDQYGLAPEPSKLDGVAIGNDLEIVSTGRYAGLFVEDGSDETVSDVFCIRVKNTGSTGVQYAHITLTRGGECYEFDITTLLPGETVPGPGAQPPDPAGETGGAYRRRDHLCPLQRDALHARRRAGGGRVPERHHRYQPLRRRHVPGLCLLQKRQRRPCCWGALPIAPG